MAFNSCAKDHWAVQCRGSYICITYCTYALLHLYNTDVFYSLQTEGKGRPSTAVLMTHLAPDGQICSFQQLRAPQLLVCCFPLLTWVQTRSVNPTVYPRGLDTGPVH